MLCTSRQRKHIPGLHKHPHVQCHHASRMAAANSTVSEHYVISQDRFRRRVACCDTHQVELARQPQSCVRVLLVTEARRWGGSRGEVNLRLISGVLYLPPPICPLRAFDPLRPFGEDLQKTCRTIRPMPRQKFNKLPSQLFHTTWVPWCHFVSHLFTFSACVYGHL